MNNRTKVFYIKFKAITDRCNNKLHPAYRRYGGRGIKCLWNNFEEFISDMESSYKEGLTIDRIDSNGNYCKKNCRRTTMKEQCNNRSSNWKITYNGITKNFGEWVKELGIPRTTLQGRLYRGWSLERAFTK